MHLRLFFPFSALSSFSGYSQQAQKPVFVRVEEMPQFKGNMDSFIRSNLHYPENVGDLKGRVVVEVLINEAGRVTNPVIERSLYHSLDTKAIRVVRLMPDWKPARQRGKPIPFLYHIPVIFRLD